MIENLWALGSAVNQRSGSNLDALEIPLSSGAKPKLYQLREFVKKSQRQLFFKVNAVSR
ncbi:MAG: hypothetical protein HC933_00320 [Pleurocapsa sp. SU_196_0]|nr:hypothetical protein [Pleurocapsa sp. SU_196_0]